MPKHARYAEQYERFGWYWGLGIEHETYVATSQLRRASLLDASVMIPERYSVSYYKNYRPDVLRSAIADLSGGPIIQIPILMNCHSFTDCDIFGEHATTYERVPKNNPRFSGKTMFQWMCEYSSWLATEKDRVFMWDGDTVEFMTQRFYRARVEDVLTELREGEERFVAELERLPRPGILAAYAPLRLASPRNEPWATYLTNPRGISMFNNGTIHINLTLPTRLGWNRQPLFWKDFVNRHRWLARLVQWWEPLWIAAYGSGDPFAARCHTVAGRFAAGSQRLAVSRYIGVGTYDTDTMPRGKILQIPLEQGGDFPWYRWLHERCGYATLDVIGMDINFNKHGAHGLELRLFDQMPEAALRAILLDLVVLMDCAQERLPILDPRRDVRWQRAAGESLYEGAAWRVGADYLAILASVMGLTVEPKEPMGVWGALALLRRAVKSRRGYCWSVMVEEESADSVSCCCCCCYC